MKVYIVDSRLVIGRFEIPSAQYYIEWNEYVDEVPTEFRLVSTGSGQYLPVTNSGYIKITDCQYQNGTHYTNYSEFITAVGSFFVKAFSTAGGDVETRLTNLEDAETIYQIFHYTGTTQTGTVALPTGATFFDPYSDGLPNQIVVKSDANSNPIEEQTVTSTGTVVLVSTFNLLTGAYILSGVPASNSCLVYFIKTTEKDKHYIDLSKVVEIFGLGGAGAEQVNSDWNATSGVAEILNKPVISGTNTGDNIYISGTATINFNNEEDFAITTIPNVTIVNANVKSVSIIPQETVDTSLDDFTLNGVTFNIENVIDNTSFDIRGNSTNNASGVYTVKYNITI